MRATSSAADSWFSPGTTNSLGISISLESASISVSSLATISPVTSDFCATSLWRFAGSVATSAMSTHRSRSIVMSNSFDPPRWFAERTRPTEVRLRLVDRTVDLDGVRTLARPDRRSRGPSCRRPRRGYISSHQQRSDIISLPGSLMTPMESTVRPPFARPSSSDPYLAALDERVLIYDGATGTNLQFQELTADDFGGAALEGCNEILVRHATRRGRAAAPLVPRRGRGRHRDQLVRRRSRSCSKEYGIAERAHELALASATLARRVADGYASPDSPRFVAGSMGPGTKFPSLGQISYDDLSASYEELAYGLLEGGVDLLVVETMYDLLSGKAAIAACHRAMARHGRIVPIQAQVTIELTGRMLPGTEIGAAITALSPLGIDVLGLNCATGPVEMYEPLRQLSETAPMPLVVPAQRRTAERRRRQDALRPHARRARRTPGEVRHRVRRPGGGRLLRDDTRAPAPGDRGGAAPRARPRAPPCSSPPWRRSTRRRRYQPGPLGAPGGRAHQRERLQEVP